VKDLDAFLAFFEAAKPRLPLPFSVGIGGDARQAHLAIRVAKASGFGAVVRAEGMEGGVRFTRREQNGVWVEA